MKRNRALLSALLLPLGLLIALYDHKTSRILQGIVIEAPVLPTTIDNAACPRLPVFGKPFATPESASDPDIIRNLHIVYIGDSVSRYQYISLVHYFHTGHWLNDSTLLLHAGHFPGHGGYPGLFNYTNHYFSGRLRCDCFRRGRKLVKSHYENKYWRDDCRNNTLTYIGKFSDRPIQGHWDAWTVYQEKPASLDVDTKLPPVWQFNESWADAVVHHVQQLRPKPNYVYFNAGLWRPSGLNRTQFNDLVHAVRAADMIPIFRTTTKSHESRMYPNDFDQEVCPHVANYTTSGTYWCHNMTWTKQLLPWGDAAFQDPAHFRPSINTLFNQQLLELISSSQRV